MALETPNRMAACINFFYVLSPEQIIITAAEGIISLDPFPPNLFLDDGFMLTLQNPVRSTNGVWFSSGLDSPPLAEDSNDTNLTPLVQAPETGNEIVDDFAATDGNWISVFPNWQVNSSFLGIGIWEIPIVDDAETPPLPIPS